MTDDGGRRKIKSVDRSAEILESIWELRGATVTELAEHTDLTPGTVHTHLATLRDWRLVRKEGTQYDLGYQFVVLGEYVRNSSTLHRHGRQVADNLADDTGESVHLVTEDDGMEVILYESFGQNAVGTEFYIRNREIMARHLHYSAAGKAILAHLPRERIVDIVDRHQLVQRTEETITDVETLFDELERVRERGFARNDEEGVRSMRAVGSPVLDRDGDPIGAISLSAPVSRLRGETFEEAMPERVMEAANIIEVNIQTEGIEHGRFDPN
jgi:DNA-binding IclR family transcriptional regulator